MASFSYDCSTRDNMLILKSREVRKLEKSSSRTLCGRFGRLPGTDSRNHFSSKGV